MRIATASLNQSPLEWNHNIDNIRCALQWARDRETMVLCLPELCIPGIGCGLHFRRSVVAQKSMDMLLELLPELKGMIVTLGLPVEFEGNLFNAVCLVVDGKPFGFQCKKNFSEANLQELAWFRPWPRDRHVPFELNGETYKFGDLSFEFTLNESRRFHVAVEIGEPDWSKPGQAIFPEEQKLDLLLNPSASRFALEKHAKRLDFARINTKKFEYVYVMSNYVGNESGSSIYDGGSFVAEKGKIIAEAPRFSYHDAQTVIATLDEPDVRETIVELDKKEEFSRAVPLGMLDYLRKSPSKGFALSLSGGADSAALAVLTSLGVRFALAELGPTAFCQQFSHVPELEEAVTAKDEILKKFLLCFYQATRNSGEVTRSAARTVASELGAEFHELDIDSIVDGYVSIVSQALGRELTWETDDIALQNIQARARVPGAWLFANVRQSVLLATGNRSEMTLGYTTMDGDTCGALAPIAGIDKAFLRQWFQWMQQTGPEIDGIRQTMPFLSVITEQVPTAELRPKHIDEQTDEKDMMPYPVLNRIEQLGPVQGKSIEEICNTLKKEFSEYTEDMIAVWVDRFFQRWQQNLWKRHRYALSFHLDDSGLSDEDARRYPTLGGPW